MTDTLTKLRARLAFEKMQSVVACPPECYAIDFYRGARYENARLQPAIEALIAVAEAAKALPFGSLHDVKYYDSDSAPVCVKHCEACAMGEALRGLEKLEEKK